MRRNAQYARYCLFFFQAEDGIRDIGVTGVQTCALPISYTQIDFLSDIERHVFKPVYENRAPNEYELLDINMYVSSLIQYSPTLTAIEKRQKGEAVMGIADFVGGVEPTKSLSYYKQTDLEPVFFEKLTDARKLLLKAINLTKGGKEKDKIRYILLQADRVLGHSCPLSSYFRRMGRESD